MTETSHSVIIVAGGTGTRMQAGIPKQFLALAGEPILMRTIRRFFAYDPDIEIIVVLPENQLESWNYLCGEKEFKIKHKVVPGGSTRFQSVKNGLETIERYGLVAIHDGVRPFVPREVIANAFDEAQDKGNAVAAVPLKDSVRKINGTENQAVDRSQFRLIQTPQCFRVSQLKQAYQAEEEEGFTDDAAVIEKAGEKINLIEGSYGNIKITTPEDLLIAEAFLKNNP